MEEVVVEAGDAALLEFHARAGDERHGAREVGLVADQHDLAAARGQLQRIEVSTGEPVVLLDRAVEPLAGEYRGPSGPDLWAGQADVELDAESLQRLARGDRLALALPGQVAFGVRLALAILSVSVPQEPDHCPNPRPSSTP